VRAGLLLLAAPFALSLSLVLGACDDPTGFGKPEILEDTVLIAAPSATTADLPSALDVTPGGLGSVGGGKFPERQPDAEQWDVALRVRGGELVFAPPSALGLTSGQLRRAGITEPITDRAFEDLTEAPSSGRYKTDTPVPVRTGAVYGVRSRASLTGCSAYFAKIQPLEVNPARGTVRLRVATSGFCGDTRLSRED
jgi:hypothetical protein